MDKESYFISQITDGSKQYVGDDGVLVEGYVYTQDAFYENTHFKLSWMRLEDIAKKALLVNLSDAFAMNATPKYILLTISIPKHFTKNDLDSIAKGFKSVLDKYHLKLIGGDTIASSLLTFTITVISKPNKKLLYRNGVRAGDLLAYTGTIGGVKKDLRALFRNRVVNKDSKMFTPRLMPDFIKHSARYIHAAMDISDGLSTDLARMSTESRVGVKFLKSIPQDSQCSGEEYELLFSFSKKDKRKIVSLSKRYKIDINIFAKAVRGRYKSRCKSHHF